MRMGGCTDIPFLQQLGLCSFAASPPRITVCEMHSAVQHDVRLPDLQHETAAAHILAGACA